MLRKLEILLLYILLGFLSSHYLLFNIIFTKPDMLKYWKDIIIFVLFIIVIMIHNKNILKIKLYFSDLLIIFFTIFLCFYVLIAPNKVAAAYALRVYVEPFIIYFVAKNSFFNTKQIKSMTRIVFASAVITSIYGIYQALVLGPSFLMKIGYPVRSNGRLDTSFYLSGFSNFQRVASTFASPNLFAFFASIVLIIVFIYRNAFRSKLRYQIGISIICIAILLTFSRSSILALVIAFIFISIQMKAKYTKQLIGILIALVIGTSIISDFTDIGLSAKLAKYIENTITLNDTSAVSHISSYYESFEIAKNNLLGTGLGRNGPKASQYFYDPILT